MARLGFRALFDTILRFGTEAYPEEIARRLRLLNGLTTITAFFALLFGLQYAIADWEGLFPLFVGNIISAGLWVVSPMLHRYGDTVALIYFMIAVSVGFFVHCYIAGSVASSHYFLLAAPAVMLFLGAKRLYVAFPLMCAMLGTFFAVEYGLPEVSTIAPMPPAMAASKRPTAIFGASLIIFASIYYALRIAERAEAALAGEYARSENLLLNLMPTSIASRLKDRPEEIIADQFDQVTILFADIVDFTPRASRYAPSDLVRFLNRVFSEFDALAARHGLEKIKTIGDAYMVAGGMPDRREGHSPDVGRMALDMLEVTRRLGEEAGEDLQVRIGIHTGPAVAGVIGTRKLFYDVWGDTVNTASRMESHGSAGRIQVTEDARAVLGDGFAYETRGLVDIKGKGALHLYFLLGTRRTG